MRGSSGVETVGVIVAVVGAMVVGVVVLTGLVAAAAATGRTAFVNTGAAIFTFGVALTFAFKVTAALISARFCATTFCANVLAVCGGAISVVTGLSLNVHCWGIGISGR